MHNRFLVILLALICAALFVACGAGSSDAEPAVAPDSATAGHAHDHGDGDDHDHGEAAEHASAVATIAAKNDSGMSGSATFTAGHDGVTLVLEVSGVSPGEHAFHLHEIGDCSAPDGTSAGGHWNPAGEDHGRWGNAPFHLGDVGNLNVGEDGTASLTVTTDLWSVGSGEANDVVGRAVIVHAGVDDFTSQPTGAAGGRIGCGVIQ